MMTEASNTAPMPAPKDPSRIRWLASFPKSGNTWVRIFLANLMVPKTRPLTLKEVSSMPFYTDTRADTRSRVEYFGKAHYPYSLERHGENKSVYIVRDPVDVVPSCANFFGVTVSRMAKEVARDWPRHVASWWPHIDLVLRYENMPNNFHTLAQHLNMPSDFQSVLTAISHADFDGLKDDEDEHGWVEASGKGGVFFRKGTIGQGREVMTDTQVANIVNGAGEWYNRLGYE